MSSNLLLEFALALALISPSGVERVEGEAAAEGRLWETVDLPANFVLDLMSGVVASREAGERPTLVYSRGRLSSLSPLRLLPVVEEAPRIVIDRDGGEAIPGVIAAVGQELVFDCFDDAWGYLRVLEVSAEAVKLEYFLEPDLRKRELRREPGRLTARSGPRGVELRWSCEASELYSIERRHLPRHRGDRRGEWAEAARVAGGAWVDDKVSLEHLTEYRVAKLGEGGGFGATAIGAAGIEPADVHVEVGPGTELNLLSVTTDDLRVDLTVEYVHSHGVQFFPGEGVQARNLPEEEESDWVLPELVAENSIKQRFFVSPGRALVMRLPEGAHVLVRVESVRDNNRVILSRQIDLAGERVFPPLPALPEAEWQSGRGVVFDFPAARNVPAQGLPLLVVEREETLDAGDWVESARGEAGALQLVDENVGDKLLVRYRFRQGLEGGSLSPASAPMRVLVGGESKEARAALLERAILDLGSRNYDRRGRARAVLLALGESAWPILKDALRSDNAELASAARELLQAGFEGREGDNDEIAGNLARLLINIRAEELGLEAPPHPDWISPDLGERASAVLRGLGWRETSPSLIARWRQVLADADPEDCVRSVAGLTALLGVQGLAPDLGPRFPSRARDTRAEDDWLAERDLEAPPSAGKARPWSQLVELQARHEWEGSQAQSSEDLARSKTNGAMARFLSAQFDRTDDELFLDCALRLIEDPIARLRGAIDYAEARRQSDRFDDGGRPIQVIRLEAPSTDLLVQELSLLRDSKARGIEFLLPAGIYEPLPDGQQIVIEGAAFRLRGEGAVELHVGFTIMKGCDAVFENLSIVSGTGVAVNVMQSSLVLRDCRLRSGMLGLLGTEAVVELERSTVIAPRSAGMAASGLRFGGRSMLLATESRIECGGVAISGTRAALLDRCVILSHARVGIEGSTSSDLWLVNSLVRSDKAPFTRVHQGVLDGAVLFGDVGAALANSAGLSVCSEHLRCDAELATLERKLWLERCALGH